jgi:hypothetical protein
MQSLNKQIVNIVQYKISRGCPKIKLRGNLRENCMKAKGTIRTESYQVRWFSW